MKHAHTISWIVFALLGAATVALALGSLTAAYLNPSADLIAGNYTPDEVANGDAEVSKALSARRGTAAAFGLSYGILLFGIAWGPYRRRARFLPWLLTATLANAAVILLRVPLLGVRFGLGAAVIPLILVLLAGILGLIARRSSPA